MKRILFITAVTTLSACGHSATEDKKSRLNADSFRLTMDDFKPTLPLRQFNGSADLVKQLDMIGFLRPDDLGGERAPEGAYEKCHSDKYQAWPVKASGDQVVIYADVDTSSCLQYENEGQTAGTLTQRAFMSVSCPGADLSALNGTSAMAVDTLKKIDAACANKDMYMLQFYESQFDLRWTHTNQDGSTGTSRSKGKYLEASFSGDMKPCKVVQQGDVATRDDCLTIQRNVTDASLINGRPEGSDHGTEVIIKASARGLKSLRTASGPWYDSGSFGIDINGWSGAIQYRGNDTPPTFELKKGAQTASGTLTP